MRHSTRRLHAPHRLVIGGAFALGLSLAAHSGLGAGAPPAQLAINVGHSDAVTAVAFSPDSKILATASRDKGILLWPIYKKGMLFPRYLRGHDEAVRAIAFSPDGKWLASASSDFTIKLWEVPSVADVEAGGRPLDALRTLMGHTDGVVSLVFTRDGKWLVSASSDKSIKVWDPATGKLAKTLTAQNEPVSSLALNREGTLLASVGGCSADAADRAVVATRPVERFALKTVGPELINNAVLCTWDVGTWSVVGRLATGSTVQTLTFTSDGGIVTGGAGGEFKLWNVTSGARLCGGLIGNSGEVVGLALSPDAKYFAAAAYQSRAATLWDAKTCEQKGAISGGHLRAVVAVAFSPDGELLATGSSDHTTRVWKLPKGTLVHTLGMPSEF